MTAPSPFSGVPTTTRVGLVVPSSNVTMEIEIPEILRRAGGPFSFHASRMRMRNVSAEELLAMDGQADRCVTELADARCAVFAYACLVAVMAQGAGAHRRVEERLTATARAAGSDAAVVSSAGALVDSLQRLGAGRVAMVTPYVPELTAKVVDYLEAEGITATSVEGLGVADNHLVGCIPADAVLAAVDRLDLAGVDAVVLSACVQMPSLGIVERVQQATPVPVLTAATATAAAILRALGLATDAVPGGAGVPVAAG